MRLFWREELDEMVSKGCAGCNEVHEKMHIAAMCHPEAKLAAEYSVSGSTITLVCGSCGTFVCQVVVPSGAS